MNLSHRFQSILVGDNGTPEAQRAVDVASTLAHCCNARLVLLGVITPLTAEQQAEGIGLEKAEEERSALQSRIEQAADAGRAEGLDVVFTVVHGNAEEEIERFAKEHGVDLLVVGHRDISRPRKWLEGSTSEDLAHKLDISILIVHSTEA